MLKILQKRTQILSIKSITFQQPVNYLLLSNKPSQMLLALFGVGRRTLLMVKQYLDLVFSILVLSKDVK